MKIARCCLLLLPVILGTGCVERSYRVLSDPPGALVYRDGVPLGATPVTKNFTYYGKRRFTLLKEGYEPLEVLQDIEKPWYQYPFIDFVFEHLIPYTFHDHHEFIYRMEPKRQTRTDDLLERSRQQREIGKTLGPQPGAQPSRKHVFHESP